jgi:hypothetical protein
MITGPTLPTIIAVGRSTRTTSARAARNLQDGDALVRGKKQALHGACIVLVTFAYLIRTRLLVEEVRDGKASVLPLEVSSKANCFCSLPPAGPLCRVSLMQSASAEIKAMVFQPPNLCHLFVFVFLINTCFTGVVVCLLLCCSTPSPLRMRAVRVLEHGAVSSRSLSVMRGGHLGRTGSQVELRH